MKEGVIGKFVKNKLGYLSVFGLLGFGGLFTGHSALYAFFGFFGYAYYFTVLPDEMFKVHLLRSSAISFFIMIATMAIVTALVAVTENVEFAVWGFFASFALGNISFGATHFIYESKERRNSLDEGI